MRGCDKCMKRLSSQCDGKFIWAEVNGNDATLWIPSLFRHILDILISYCVHAKPLFVHKIDRFASRDEEGLSRKFFALANARQMVRLAMLCVSGMNRNVSKSEFSVLFFCRGLCVQPLPMDTTSFSNFHASLIFHHRPKTRTTPLDPGTMLGDSSNWNLARFVRTSFVR